MNNQLKCSEWSEVKYHPLNMWSRKLAYANQAESDEMINWNDCERARCASWINMRRNGFSAVIRKWQYQFDSLHLSTPFWTVFGFNAFKSIQLKCRETMAVIVFAMTCRNKQISLNRKMLLCFTRYIVFFFHLIIWFPYFVSMFVIHYSLCLLSLIHLKIHYQTPIRSHSHSRSRPSSHRSVVVVGHCC